MKFMKLFIVLFACSVSVGTVSVLDTSVSYSCNGSTTAFAFTFSVSASSDVKVVLRTTSTGAEEVLVETTDYTVAAASGGFIDGGTVTTVSAYSSSYTLTVMQNVPITQPTDLTESPTIEAETLEDAYDRGCMLALKLNEKLGRALTIPLTDSAITVELPSSVDRASKVLSFDSSGNATVSSAVPTGSVSFSTLGTNIAEVANAGTAMNLLLPRIDCRQYAASGSGTLGDPWVDALREAYTANGVQNHYYLPAGHYKDASTIDIEGSGRIRITGDGVEVTKIHYAVADATSAIKFHNDGSVCVEIFMSDLSFDGDGTCTGAAIEIEDLQIGAFENLTIEDFDGATTAKGVWLKGRDRITFDKIIFSNTPIHWHIDNNPNNAIDLDHCRFLNINGGCDDTDNGYGWKIDCNDQLNNLTWENIGINNCLYGVYYKAATAGASPQTWSFRNMRVEQGGADSWAFHLEGTATYPLKGVLFENVYFGAKHGLKLVYGWETTILNCWFPMGAGYTWADICDNSLEVAFINTRYNPAGTDARPVDAELVYKVENATNGYIGFALYDDSRTSWRNHFNSIISNEFQALADNATPTLKCGNLLTIGGTTTITDFDDGQTGQAITVIAGATVKITDGTNIRLEDNRDWTMQSGDTLTLVQKADTYWYETARSHNTSSSVANMVCYEGAVSVYENEVLIY